MTRQETIKRVVEKYGEQITVSHKSAPVYNEDTGWSDSEDSTSQTYVIPYDYFPYKTDFVQEGNLSNGAISLIVPGDVTGITEEDSFDYRSKTYRIKTVNPLPLEGSYLAYVITGNEEL